MAGGRSRRLGYDKLTLSFCGLPLAWIAYVKLKKIFPKVHVAVTGQEMEKLLFLKFLGAEMIETPGLGYPEDVKYLLGLLKRPFLLVASDALFVKTNQIEEFLKKAGNKSLAAAVKVNGKTSYVGLNYVFPGSDKDELYFFDDKQLSISINVMHDLESVKEWLYRNGCFSLLQ